MEQNVFIPTESRFREIVREEQESILKRLIPQIVRQSNRKEFLTTSDVEELTGMSPRMQKYHRDAGNLPYMQEGRKIVYNTIDVESFWHERMID